MNLQDVLEWIRSARADAELCEDDGTPAAGDGRIWVLSPRLKRERSRPFQRDKARLLELRMRDLERDLEHALRAERRAS